MNRLGEFPPAQIAGARRAGATRSRARTLFEGLVGRRSGIVRDVALVETIDGDAALQHAGARIANPYPEFAETTALNVGGSGTTREAALVAALCEGAERYAAAGPVPEMVGPIAPAQLDAPALAAGQFVQFSADQRRAGLPFELPAGNTPLAWIPGTNAATGAKCYVPAFAVVLPYIPAGGEPAIGPGLSTGLCCADDRDAAVLGGLCEVIERDSLALTWLKGITPPRFDRQLVHDLAGDLLPPADDARAYELTTDLGVPVVLVVCRGTGPTGPLYSVGSASHPDWRRALRKAAQEASQDRVYVRMLLQTDPQWQPGPAFEQVTSFDRHARLYSTIPHHAEEAFAFLDLGDLRKPRAASAADVAPECGYGELAARLACRGLECAWIDLTPEWARALGLCIVRVVAPGLLPLHGHHGLAYLGHARLRDWRSAAPHGVCRHHQAVWPWPHPFP